MSQVPTATMNSPSTQNYASNPEVCWYRAPVYLPYIWIPGSPDIGQQFRRHPIATVVDGAVGTEIVRSVLLDVPSTVYAMTGSAIVTAQGAFPVGWDSRDAFRVRVEHPSGDRLDVNAALGSAMVGRADRPAPMGGPGWSFTTGSSVRVGVTPMFPGVTIDIVLWIIELRGRSNFYLTAG